MWGYKLSLFFYRRILITKLNRMKRKDSQWNGDAFYNHAIDDAVKLIKDTN